MTAGSQAVKSTAKTALKNNWVKAIVCCTVFLFCFLLCYNISSLVGYISTSLVSGLLLIVGCVFLIIPVGLGVLRFFWRMIHGANDSPLICFWYFSSKSLYLRAIKLTFSLGIRALGYGMILYLPVVAVRFFSGGYIYDMLDMAIPMWTANLEHLSVFLRTLATVALFFLMLRYYSAPVLTVSDDGMDIAEAIHMSVTVSKGTLLDFIYLFFSFIGWILLSVLFIPLIFTLPYMVTSYVVHVRFAIADYNKQISSMEDNDFPSYSVGS